MRGNLFIKQHIPKDWGFPPKPAYLVLSSWLHPLKWSLSISFVAICNRNNSDMARTSLFMSRALRYHDDMHHLTVTSAKSRSCACAVRHHEQSRIFVLSLFLSSLLVLFIFLLLVFLLLVFLTLVACGLPVNHLNPNYTQRKIKHHQTKIKQHQTRN